jgi:hypothetical protein
MEESEWKQVQSRRSRRTKKFHETEAQETTPQLEAVQEQLEPKPSPEESHSLAKSVVNLTEDDAIKKVNMMVYLNHYQPHSLKGNFHR